MARRYAVLDVFTGEALAGNPLAVVLDSDGLDAKRMQAIAREFNLSETVFVLPPPRPGVSAAIRIFTPGKELPFAGHPTIGTAVLLATDRLDGITRETDAVVVLQAPVGAIRCAAVVRPGLGGRALFDVPKLPEELPFHGDLGLAASALSLNRSDVGFENHVPTVFAAGGPTFAFLPVRDLGAMSRILVNAAPWLSAFGTKAMNVFAYTRECVHHESSFHARMFAPDLGIGEDPATGSAAAAFAGVLMRFDGASDGEREVVIEQGYEMGRPSQIDLTLVVEKGRLSAARIGGEAVIVARGELYL